MLISKYPSRISLAGGSTDQEKFLNKFKNGMVINFASDIFNTITTSQDKLGKNSYEDKYVVIYSKREETNSIDEITNDIVKYSLKEVNYNKKLTTIFLSDISSVGSGLACSSAYTLAFNRTLEKLTDKNFTPEQRCMNSYLIEKNFNPLLGMQDTYGCGIPGLKALLFKKDEAPVIEQLKTSIFDELDMHLIFTGKTRNSTDLLKNLNFENDSLLKICEKFYHALIDNKIGNFLNLINDGWIAKKNTSSLMTEAEEIIYLDKQFEQDKNILAHRLCGAGNGGFFLLFTEKNIQPFYKNTIKINIINQFDDLRSF